VKYKYVLLILGFLLYIGFIDEHNLVRRYRLWQEEKALRAEIERYREEFNENTRRLRELESDPAAIERIARENYGMHGADEDVYVIEK
jgi:cell division protein FtsB